MKNLVDYYENKIKSIILKFKATPVITDNIKGISVACSYPVNTYYCIFVKGVNATTLEQASAYAMFIVYCKIYNKDVNHIVKSTRETAENLYRL